MKPIKLSWRKTNAWKDGEAVWHGMMFTIHHNIPGSYYWNRTFNGEYATGGYFTTCSSARRGCERALTRLRDALVPGYVCPVCHARIAPLGGGVAMVAKAEEEADHA